MSVVSDPQTSYDFAALSALKAQAVRDRSNDETIKETAKQFEAMFLQMMLKSMREAVPQGGLFDSKETQTFEQMLDQQFALAMSERGSTGLSQMVEQFIRRSQSTADIEPQQKNLKLETPSPTALPLVNESDKYRIPEGATQSFLQLRDQLRLKGGQ